MNQQAEKRRAAVRRFMNERGLKAKPWAVSAGLGDGVVRNFLAGRANSLTSDSLEKLAAAAEATVAEIIGEKPKEMRPGRDVVAIKSLEISAGMGRGVVVADEPEGPPVYFRREWIEKILEHRPGQLRVLPLTGDSNMPTINDGDVGLVLIPGEDAKFQSGSFYALWDGQGLIVKRLESIVGADRQRLRIISDNRSIYEPYEVDADDVRIIGQIVWRGGRI